MIPVLESVSCHRQFIYFDISFGLTKECKKGKHGNGYSYGYCYIKKGKGENLRSYKDQKFKSLIRYVKYKLLFERKGGGEGKKNLQ